MQPWLHLAVPRRANPPGYLLTIGARIRSQRKLKEFSREAIAEAVGLSVTSIAQIERGETEPSFLSVIRILVALELTFEQLTDGLALPAKE